MRSEAMFFCKILSLSLLISGLNPSLAQKKSAGKSTAAKPNIIYIMADDLGYGDVGFNGQQKIKTPNIDRLAGEGIIFNQHYAGTAVCGPSRAALLTGVNTAHAHVRELSAWTVSGKPVDLLDEEVTVAEELKRAGYKTAIIGKWGLEEGAGTGAPNAQGYDYFYGYKTHTEAHHYYPEYIWENGKKITLENNVTAEKKGNYSNDDFTSKAIRFIKDNKSGPFFLYLPYTVPHNEITVPEDSKKPYLNQGWTARPMTAGHYYHDAEGNTTYAGMVSRLDGYVGQILQTLKDQGIDENTVVIFTSDNGPGFDNGFFDSNGPFKGKKFTLYEGGIRVPFAARWPARIKAGSKTSHPSAFWDFLPTACEIAGIKPSAKIDGVSYLPTLLGNAQQPKHDFLYWEINEAQGPAQAIQAGEWKGLAQYNKAFELYHLATDPGETTNVAGQNPAVVKRLKETLIATRTENPEFPLTKRSSHYASEKPVYHIYAGSTHAHTSYTESHGSHLDKAKGATKFMEVDSIGVSHAVNSPLKPDWQKHQGPPSEHFGLAKANGYDFYISTDHSQEAGFHPTSDKNAQWISLHDQASKATDKNFVALAGYEHSENNGPGGRGHINVINSAAYLNALEKDVDIKVAYKWLGNAKSYDNDGPVIASFNHPDVKSYDSFQYRDEKVTDVITLLEVINSNKNIHYEGFLAALNAGWKVSPVAGNDNHGTAAISKQKSRTFVLAESKSKRDILNAMKNRRTYASLDQNIQCQYWVNGQIMGSTLNKPDEFKFDINISDPDVANPANKIRKIEILKDNGVVVESLEASAHSVKWEPVIKDSTSKYFFIRVFSAGDPGSAENHAKPVAWLAPVWTGR
ncbi:sulfatase-like hydrolase/transferase [Dyadobacter sp. CY323]|uniref:sulfatase-like hydrolase/transferase n=1 Tax=Dyadobacter sp. CY323 TaxID=2907302 RepID=UPI001F2DC841|nr:sulfatase-like hydrolase/transferase [Dyadobacter sp. CY323]MCE6991417.1 sulfatase-like hydrolase/transferase [Dyadobacter sp. CY323]